MSNEYAVCKNCGYHFMGNYCNHCGQSYKTNRLNFNNAWQNVLGGFSNISDGFLYTLLNLLYRPGYMIKDYIGGKRIRYFKPFQTLFVLAAIYIVLAQLIDPTSLTKEIMSDDKNKKELFNATLNKAEDKQQGDSLNTDSVAKKKSIIKLGAINIEINKDADNQRKSFVEKVWNLISGWTNQNKAASILLTIPLFAIATRLAFRRKKTQQSYNVTEHVFIQTYIACQCLLISILYALLTWQATFDDFYDIPIFLIFALFVIDYKQIFNKSWPCTIWRTILMFFYSILLLIIFAIILVLLSTLLFIITGHIKFN